MKSFFLLLGIVMMVVASTWAHRVNYETRDVMAHVTELQREITRERRKLAVLEAEWAYLNRPDRLLALSNEYFEELRLSSLNAKHFADPMKVAYPSPQDPLLAELIAAAVREVQGGSE